MTLCEKTHGSRLLKRLRRLTNSLIYRSLYFRSLHYSCQPIGVYKWSCTHTVAVMLCIIISREFKFAIGGCIFPTFNLDRRQTRKCCRREECISTMQLLALITCKVRPHYLGTVDIMRAYRDPPPPTASFIAFPFFLLRWLDADSAPSCSITRCNHRRMNETQKNAHLRKLCVFAWIYSERAQAQKA